MLKKGGATDAHGLTLIGKENELSVFICVYPWLKLGSCSNLLSRQSHSLFNPAQPEAKLITDG
jgi:hypothetical protein